MGIAVNTSSILGSRRRRLTAALRQQGTWDRGTGGHDVIVWMVAPRPAACVLVVAVVPLQASGHQDELLVTLKIDTH